jgi:hypothetical protein
MLTIPAMMIGISPQVAKTPIENFVILQPDPTTVNATAHPMPRKDRLGGCDRHGAEKYEIRAKKNETHI